MVEQVMELVRALGGAGQDGELLRTLCQTACRTLGWRLRDDGFVFQGVKG